MAGKTVATLKAETLEKLRQPALNYDRYSEANILGAINDASLEVASRLRCIHAFAIIILKDGFGQYKPPEDMIYPKKAFFYQSSTSYIDLTRTGWKSREWLDRYLPGWRVTNGDPLYAYIGDSIGNLRKIGFTPTPDTDGTDYASSPDTGVVISATGMTTSGNITGTNTTAHATDCIDFAARTLSSLGVQVGMVALNVTDGSSGQISAVSGSTFTATLTGGTANTWRVGDSFTILAGEYGVITSWEDTQKYIFSTDLGELIAIGALTGNVYLEYSRRPLELQYDTQYPEIPQELHGILPEYALWLLKRTCERGSNDLADAMAGFQAFEKALSGYQTVDQATEENFVRFRW